MSKLDLISIVSKKENWELAIKRGVSLLVKQGITTNQLADEIIKSTKNLGPYYVLMPYVALAHTSPGEYNKKIGISLVVYKEPISFSEKEHHQVKLLFTLSAKDGDSHMDLLAKFAEVMSKKSIVNYIIEENNIEKIYETIKGFL